MAKTQLHSVTAPGGFRAAGVTGGIKASGKPDVAIIVADECCVAAGVFTRNQVKGAPVIISQRHVRNGHARAIVCNSGCSNVATGQRGLDDAVAMCQDVAQRLGCDPHEVLVCSTGVIGRPLPMDKVRRGIELGCEALAAGPAADADAARAIMTTDLVPKHALREATVGGKTVRLGGIAKGSGMIAPNMATMLVFLTTDVAIDPKLLRQALCAATAASFNRISVDSDTSTSDSVLILASGAAKNRTITQPGKALDAFTAALTDLCRDLAYQVIQDGEGATKVFRVQICGARSEKDADKVGRAVVDSPLVKTAVHGGDPNWGRLAMAVGKSGAAFDPAALRIAIGDTAVYEHEVPLDLTPAREKALEQVMAKKEITFRIDLGKGEAAAEWLGCDLSREYITINADYTT